MLHARAKGFQRRDLKTRLGSTKQNRTVRALAIDDKEAELRRKIAQWKKIQEVYMPGLRRPQPAATSQQEGSHPDSVDADANADANNDVEVWDIKLQLPSSLAMTRRAAVCDANLVAKEIRLRVAQADDALEDLRRVLRTITTLERHQHTQTAGSGVAANTRMLSMITKHRHRRDRIAARYRAARLALQSLQPGGSWTVRLKELKKEHVRPPRKVEGEGEGRVDMSWIWTTSHVTEMENELDGTQPPTDKELDEGLRVDWVMSLARAERWEEEVTLVPIEMRRVLRRLLFRAHGWGERSDAKEEASDRVKAGLRAYGAKKAWICRQMAYSFSSEWLTLFKEHNYPTPSGWPSSCGIIRIVTRNVRKRRDRQKMRILAVTRREAAAHEEGADSDSGM